MLRLAVLGVVTTAHQDRCVAIGGDPDLMAEDADIQIAGLRRLVAQGAVCADFMDGDRARVVVSDQDMSVLAVKREMQRSPA